MKKQIIANFKMNLTASEIKNYIISLAPKFKDEKVDITLALPFTALSMGKFLLEGTGISLGAQNLSDEEKGALTGEVSGAMLKEAGATKVIVGHSERRSKFKENGKMINKKIKIALKNRLQVVLCIGETLLEKNAQKIQAALSAQLDEALKGLYENELENIIIAYEPVWAVGTNKNATAKEIQEGVKAIRKSIEHAFSKKAADEICVLYGGSVNAKNITQVVGVKDLGGVLVGNASCDSAAFLHIVSAIESGK